MVFVITQLKLSIKKNEYETGDANRQTQHIEE